ncbi:MAG: hypothetical protein NZ901_03120 [Geminocystis sp.]|nr:hypothetical protein [Geminocystis sp.]MCX8078613.1 hypothetical protein [Geminocystis sp.]HIK38837.1 hypothetical protein [Geminocystis sp. M7585_C2015_104]
MMSETKVYRVSILIRFTLVNLYLALTLPLPFLLYKTTGRQYTAVLLFVPLIVVGLFLVVASLSEQVVLDEGGISVIYPRTIQWLWRNRVWSLSWQEIESLKGRTTSQGGMVYYLVSKNRDKAYLLPMRVAGFARMVRQIQEKTGIDTTDVKPLAQPWMYLFLLFFTFFLWLVDFWAIFNSISLA